VRLRCAFSSRIPIVLILEPLVVVTCDYITPIVGDPTRAKGTVFAGYAVRPCCLARYLNENVASVRVVE
jgi:hypothetical protein